MSRLFQIYEEDLAELERVLPDLAARVMTHPDYGNRDKVQLRRVQEIVRNVRWDYGPHAEVERADPEPPHPSDGADWWKGNPPPTP